MKQDQVEPQQPQQAQQVHQYVGVHLFLGLIISVAALLFFLTIARAVVSQSAIVQLDQNISQALHQSASPFMTQLMIGVSLLGFEGLWVLVIIVAIFFAVHRQWTRLIVWVASWGGGEILNQVLKQYFNRARPHFENPFAIATNASFPSGHAMFSSIAYGMLAYFILLGVKDPRVRLAIITFFVLLVLLIGYSRIYLGVHYFTDVVAGYAAGLMWLAVCITAMEAARWRVQHKREGLSSTSP